MTDFNGSSMGLGVLIGELRAESRHTWTAIERQNSILIDIRHSIDTLPSRMSLPPVTAPSRLLPELSELIRALYPILILMAALATKSALPDTGILTVVLEMVGASL